MVSALNRRGAALVLLVIGCSSTEGANPPSFSQDWLLDPKTCANCHPTHYEEWADSMHAQAADDPIFLAMNRRAQREAQVGDFCVKCHAPMAVELGLTHDGLNLQALPQLAKGVTCYFCHSVDAVEGTHNNPLRLATDGTLRGSLLDPAPNGAHRSVYSRLHDRRKLESSSLCGACHDVQNRHGLHIERTFAEWKASAFAQTPGGTTCNQCHMPKSNESIPIAASPNLSPRSRHAHDFPGLDVSLSDESVRRRQEERLQPALSSALQSALCVTLLGERASLMVVLSNVASAHGFPTGAVQHRQAWVELKAYREGALFYSSGAVDDETATLDSSDPDPWFIRGCAYDAQRKPVEMLWDAVGLQTNQLPAQATFDRLDARFYQNHVYRTYPRGAVHLLHVPDRVTMRVRVAPIAPNVINSLIDSGDLDPAIPERLPTFDLGAALEWTPAAITERFSEGGQAVNCVSRGGLQASAARVPDPGTPPCDGEPSVP